VIAEGVEDEITLKRLANLGCDLAQGYYFGRPLPSQEFVRLSDLIGGKGQPSVQALASVPPELSIAQRSQARG
jgi:EAL domain-containing protein (putative c-di-GMP-specific phosphodiesterase class I)